VVDSNREVPDLYFKVMDPKLQVADLKSKVGSWDPAGSPNLTPGCARKWKGMVFSERAVESGAMINHRSRSCKCAIYWECIFQLVLIRPPENRNQSVNIGLLWWVTECNHQAIYCKSRMLKYVIHKFRIHVSVNAFKMRSTKKSTFW